MGKRVHQLWMRNARERPCENYLRGTDLAHIPDDLIALYDDGTGAAGQLIYRPQDLGVLLLDQDTR
jgi:hypothetical protein